MINYYFKQKKGSILVIVTIIMAAIMLLGSMFARLSYIEKKIAHNQEKAVQAFYLADSGIELALGFLEQNYYKDLDLPLNFKVKTEDNNGEIIVSLQVEENDSDSLIINSVGKIGPVNESLKLKITALAKMPICVEDALQLGWVEADGLLKEGDKIAQDGEHNLLPIKFELPVRCDMADPLPINLTALSIYFEAKQNSLEIYPGSTLNIFADLVVFRGNVILSDCAETMPGSPGQLFLYVSSACTPGEEIKGGHPGKYYGIVYFEEEVKVNNVTLDGLKGNYYYFPSDFPLHRLVEEDIYNSLIKINYPFMSEHYVWSAN
ncbi:MAG: hypothetical protein GX767_07280 [Firmicutes bacterium]|nr:hypothetical protein [Bacillota bacterium]